MALTLLLFRGGGSATTAAPVDPLDTRWGTHAEALYNAQAGGVNYTCCGMMGAISAVTTAVVSLVNTIGQDPTQIQPQIQQTPTATQVKSAPSAYRFTPEQLRSNDLTAVYSPALGYTLAAPPIRPYQAKPQDDPTQVAPVIQPSLGDTRAEPVPRAYVATPQTEPSQIAPIATPALGFTLERTPVVPAYTAAPQADPTQIQPAIQQTPTGQQAVIQPKPAPFYVSSPQSDPTQIQPQTVPPAGPLVPPPLTPLHQYQASPQNDPTQIAPSLTPALGSTLPLTPIVAYVAAPQQDPTQIAPLVVPSLAETRAEPVPRAFVAAPQQDPTQIAPAISRALGFTLPRPPITPFAVPPQADITQIAPAIQATPTAPQVVTTPARAYVSAPQQDPTQIQPVLIETEMGQQAQLSIVPVPPTFFAYQADTTQIQPAIFQTPTATPVIAPPSGLSPLDPRVIARKRHNFGVKWGFEPERTFETPVAQPEKKVAKASGIAVERLADGLKIERPVIARAPAEVKPVFVQPSHKVATVAQPEKPKKKEPKPLTKLEVAAAEAVSPVEVERDALAAQIARMQAEVEKLAAKMEAAQVSLEKTLEAEKVARKAQEHRARAAEEETTRQVAHRAEEARQAEVDLRRARNNLVAVQTAIKIFFESDEG